LSYSKCESDNGISPITTHPITQFSNLMPLRGAGRDNYNVGNESNSETAKTLLKELDKIYIS
tara:strand:- start:500 stop:685 length:186 start_codon:yes stop_codon:yes gene_type:complete